VGHDDSERRIDEKWLGIFPFSPADCGISSVADSNVSCKPLEVIRRENISDEPVSLFRVEMSVIGDDSGRILTPVLDRQEPLINVFEDVFVSQNSDDATH
jgi:hypothetical protein